MTVEINPAFEVGHLGRARCQLDCQNGGYCNFVTRSPDKQLQLFARGSLLEHCVCRPGFAGIACETRVESCSYPDLICHSNGTPCSQRDSDGSWVCDCSVAATVSHFARSMCQSPQTSYCGQGDVANRSFCTNGGICKANLSHSVRTMKEGAEKEDETNENEMLSTHNGCHCPPEFEGPHCEYLRDTTISNKHVHEKDSASAPQKNPHPGTSTDEESKQDLPSEPELGQENDNIIEAAPQAPVTIQQASTKKHNSHTVAPESVAPVASEIKAVLEEEDTKRESLIPVQDKAIKYPASAPGADPVSPPALHSVQATSISSLGSMPSNNNGGFSIPGSLGGFALVIVAIAVITLRAKRQKLRKEMLDRDTYKDETPIHLHMFGELERIAGTDDVGYEDEEDLHSVSECSLEEVELELDDTNKNLSNEYRQYLTHIRDGGYQDYEDGNSDPILHFRGSSSSDEIDRQIT